MHINYLPSSVLNIICNNLLMEFHIFSLAQSISVQAKQHYARARKKRWKMLYISCKFQQTHCTHQRWGFLFISVINAANAYASEFHTMNCSRFPCCKGKMTNEKNWTECSLFRSPHRIFAHAKMKGTNTREKKMDVLALKMESILD